MSNREAIEKIESKLASGELTPDYYVRQAIVTRYAENHGGLQLVGGVLVAVVGFSLVGWMGGAGIGLVAAQHMLNWHKQRSKDWEAIDSGHYAHLLTPAEAKHYERIYGKGSLQAAKQGDYSHAGIELDEAIDVPAEAVENVAKKSEPPLDFLQSEIEALAGEDAAATPEPSADDSSDSRTPSPITTAIPESSHVVAQANDRFAWAKDLLHFPAVLIWGAQGSGKTSFAAWLLHQRIQAGHTAEIWDVHREFGQWNGLAVYGDGMDYEAVDRRMNAFENQVKADYKERARNPKFNPKRHTIVCEEFTNFARRCGNSAPFFEAALSDLRKVKKGVIFVSHDRSLAALGGSKGFSKARNNGLLELQLEATIDPTIGDPMPALKGRLKYPGKASIEVEISSEMRGSMDFSSAVQAGSAPVEDLNQNGSAGSGLTRGSDSRQWLNRCLEASSSDSEPSGSEFSSADSGSELSSSKRFTLENLTASQAVQRIQELRSAGLNQGQIIFVLWKVRKGGSQSYQDAVNEYKLLTEGRA